MSVVCCQEREEEQEEEEEGDRKTTEATEASRSLVWRESRESVTRDERDSSLDVQCTEEEVNDDDHLDDQKGS